MYRWTDIESNTVDSSQFRCSWLKLELEVELVELRRQSMAATFGSNVEISKERQSKQNIISEARFSTTNLKRCFKIQNKASMINRKSSRLFYSRIWMAGQSKFTCYILPSQHDLFMPVTILSITKYRTKTTPELKFLLNNWFEKRITSLHKIHYHWLASISFVGTEYSAVVLHNWETVACVQWTNTEWSYLNQFFEERAKAQAFIFKLQQQEQFAEEMKSFNAEKENPKSRKLIQCSPFLPQEIFSRACQNRQKTIELQFKTSSLASLET